MLGETFKKSFGDKRLDKRGNDIVRDILVKGVHSIRQFSQNSSQQKACYRFLRNNRTTEETIIKSMAKQCAASVKGKVVLSIQDTTEINLYNHKNRISHDDSIGVTNASKNGLGFMLHPSLVIDAQSCFPYGYSHIHLFNRDLEREDSLLRNKHRYKKLDIKQKESNKWLSSSQATKAVLSEAAAMIIVQDREGDIYEQFATIPDEKTHLLIRAKSDRVLPDGKKLFDKVSGCDIAGSYSFRVEGDKRKERQTRIAKLHVRFAEIELKNSSRTAEQIAPTTKLWCVEAKEDPRATVKNAVCWRLLTTIPVVSFDQALSIIDWYSCRWMIEEVFRILKKEGFDIEASELTKGRSVKKLSLLMLDSITKIFQVRIAMDQLEEEGLPANICFTKKEIECIEQQSKKLEGKTDKLKNPNKKSSLKFATWVIARLGGWKGYASERKPGITTLWIGLDRFYNIFDGWTLEKDVSAR